MLRRIHDPERGASLLEYGAVIVLCTAILAAILGTGLLTRVTEGVRTSADQLFSGQAPEEKGAGGGEERTNNDGSGSGADGGEPGGADDDPPVSERSGEGPSEDSDSAADSPDDTENSPDVSEDGAENVVFDPEAHQELVEAEEELAEAEEELDALEEDDVYDVLLDTLAELIGYNDAKKCVTEGDIMSCVWTVASLTPVKVAAITKATPKILKQWNRWRKSRKAKRAAEQKVEDARDRRDQARGTCQLGGNRGNSFAAGTPVLMADGSAIAIEDVQTGDEVHAFDPLTGEEGPRPVTAVIEGDGPKTLVEVTTVSSAGEITTVTATSEHPFWVPSDARWVKAVDLDVGTRLRTSSGDWARVTALDTHQAVDSDVYNLAVEDLHTYYVLAGSTEVLVHNSKPGNGCGDSAQEQGVSLNKIKDKQLKKILKDRYDTEPHEFKEDYVGKKSVSKFDVSKGDDGHLWLVSKDGKTTIQTNETWR